MEPQDIVSYTPLNTNFIEILYRNGAREKITVRNWSALLRSGFIPEISELSRNAANEYYNCDDFSKKHNGASLYEFNYVGNGVVRAYNRGTNTIKEMTIEQFQTWYGPNGQFKILATCGNEANYNAVGQHYMAEQAAAQATADLAAAQAAQAAQAAAAARLIVTIRISKSRADVTVLQNNLEVARAPISNFYVDYILPYIIWNGNMEVGIRDDNPYHLSLEQAQLINKRRVELMSERDYVSPVEDQSSAIQQARDFLATKGIYNPDTYRKWSVRNHPDKNPDMAQDFQEVSAAAQIMKENKVIGFKFL